MTTLILASIFAVKFAGGTPNEFIAALSQDTQQNVMMTQGDGTILSRAEFETSDLNEMSRAIRAQLQHVILPGTDLIISDQLVPRELVAENQVQRAVREGAEVEIILRANEALARSDGAEGARRTGRFEANRIALPKTAIQDGKVTFKTEGNDALQIAMAGQALSKPVKVHWFYDRSPIFINVKDQPEEEFARWLAKAVGARLVVNAKEYAFELNPTEARRRAVATIQSEPLPQRNAESQTAARNFRVACLNALTPVQITAALAESRSSVRIELTQRSPLTRLAVQRVQQIDAERQSRPMQGPPGQAQLTIMKRVDPSRLAVLIVDSRFGVRMEIPVLDQNGRPAGVVRL